MFTVIVGSRVPSTFLGHYGIVEYGLILSALGNADVAMFAAGVAYLLSQSLPEDIEGMHHGQVSLRVIDDLWSEFTNANVSPG